MRRKRGQAEPAHYGGIGRAEVSGEGRYFEEVERSREMKIGDKEFKEIQIIGKDKVFLASITDENIIEHDDIEVVCIPLD